VNSSTANKILRIYEVITLYFLAQFNLATLETFRNDAHCTG